MILTPILAYWSIVPVYKKKLCAILLNCQSDKSKHIGVSFGHTWVNFAISNFSGLAYFIVLYGLDAAYSFLYVVCVPFYLFSILTLLIIQKTIPCCCTCSCLKTELTYLNVDHLSMPIDLVLIEQSSPEIIFCTSDEEIKTQKNWIKLCDQYCVLVIVIISILPICIFASMLFSE